MIKTCSICGKTFDELAHYTRYCSKDCQRVAARLRFAKWYEAHHRSQKITVACAFCGREFTKTAGTRTKYCSASCRSKSNNRDYYARKHLDRTVERICKGCGKTFQTANKSQVYCSRTCSQHYRRGIKTYTKTCPVCGKTFQTSNKSHIVCSASCREKFEYSRKHVGRVTRTCSWCGQAFETTAGSMKKHCSIFCRNQFQYWGTPEKRKAAMVAKASERRVSRHAIDGLTDAQRLEVIRAQDGDPAQLYRLSQGWNDKQRKFAKDRYMERHGLKAGFCEFSH